MKEYRYTLLIAALTLFFSAAHSQQFKHAWPDTNFDLTNINLDEIMSGGPPKDGIPPIDHPAFDSVATAKEWIDPLEPVVVVRIGDTSRAYPLQILTWHEIVNDEVAGTPISVTFCPLCNASIVFDRRLAGEVLDFGTTGLLRKSDLIMYDRQTESWWQQFIGKGIVGDYMGITLDRIPSSITSFESFAKAYPDALVLNRDTGISRPYGRNPYPGYDNINSHPFLFRDKLDDRLPAMERVIGITMGETQTVYPFSLFEDKTIIEDSVGGVEVLVVSTGDVLSALDAAVIADSRAVGEVSAWQRKVSDSDIALSFELNDGQLRDTNTGSSWNKFGEAIDGPLKGSHLLPVDSGIHFAFAWLAFNPNSTVYPGN